MSAILAAGRLSTALVAHAPRFAASGSVVESRGMATLKEVANRIKSVKNIAKITKSMKMVAASKLRRATSSMLQAREYVAGIQEFFEKAPQPEGTVATTTPGGKRKHLIIAVTTDRGLCGGLNSTVARQIRAMVRKLDANTVPEILIIGEKGNAQMKRDLSGYFSYSFLETSKAAFTFASASVIAEKVIRSNFDEATLVYNFFKNKISYITTQRPIRSLKSFQEAKLESGAYEFDSDCLTDLYEFYVANSIFQSCVENSTVELSSRTMAMDNATRNATAMIDRLTLFYNRSRQASITRELIEIISGAAAV